MNECYDLSWLILLCDALSWLCVDGPTFSNAISDELPVGFSHFFPVIAKQKAWILYTTRRSGILNAR